MKKFLASLGLVFGLATTAFAQGVIPAGGGGGTASSVSITQGGNTAAVNASGQLSITCANCSGSGASAVDDAAFTPAVNSVAPAGAMFDDVSPDTVNEGDAGILRMSVNRNLYVTLRDAAGNERGLNIDASGQLAVNATQWAGTAISVGNGASGTGVLRVTVANDSTGILASIGSITSSIVPGTGATNLGKAEDAAHTTGDVGVMVLTKRTDTAASSAGTDGDYATLNSDANGNLRTNIFGITQAAGTYLTVRISDGSNYSTVGTDYTHDAALTVGSTAGPASMARAVTSLPTAVSADDAVLEAATTQGQKLVVPTAAAFGGSSNYYLTSAATTNSTNVKASAGTIYDINVINTTATLYYLRLYDASSAPTCSSATNFIESIPIPASTTGAGVSRSFPVGRAYGTGIGFCLTAGGSSTDNTSAAAGVYISMGYK